MPVKTETEVSAQLRCHWLKAGAAIELRNFGYAISLLQGILKEEPEFLTGRHPLDAEAVRLGKDSAAQASMKTGGWTHAETYRDMIKEKGE